MQLAMRLARWISFLLIFPSAAFAQSTFSCPANQYVTTQLVNTGQACSGLPAVLSQNTTGTAANVTGVVAPANGGRIINTQTAGTGGVTVNTFVATDTSAPTKFITAPSGSCGSGIALATAASGVTFTLSGYDGTMQVVADSGGATAGHLIVGSTVTPGDAMDSGQTSSLNISEKTTVCGTAMNTVAAGGLVTLNPRSRGSFGHLLDNINGTLLSGLATGVLENTTGTGIPVVVGAPSGAIVGNSDTQTLTNKRITKRTGTTASSATPAINTDTADFYSITALAAAITSFTTNLSGTPTENQTLWIAITDNGTARALSWGSSFEASASGVALPATTVVSTRLDVGFVWNTVTSKWRVVAVN
jgi:hypothetical protein